MRNPILRALVPALLILPMISAPAAFAAVTACAGTGATFAGGSGTSANPYLISNQTQLAAITGGYLSCSFSQSAAITLTGSWTPIGPLATPFTGEFDGNSYAIAGLAVNTPSSDYAGLFGKISGAQITDLNLSGTVTGKDYVGSVAGVIVTSTVQDIVSTVSVTGSRFVGGIVGSAESTSVISDASVDANVEGIAAVVGTQYISAGGIVGEAFSSTISNVRMNGNVTGNRGTLGGIAGYLYDSRLSNARVAGNVSGFGTGFVRDYLNGIGGIVGEVSDVVLETVSVTGNVLGYKLVGGTVGYADEMTLTNSTVAGDVTGEFHVGGIGGELVNTTASDLSVQGNVTARDDIAGGYSSTGGLFGATDGVVVSDASFTGTVDTKLNQAGGLVGFAVASTFSASYANGTVRSDGSYVGGLIGEVDFNSQVSASYADAAVTGVNYVGGLIGYSDSTTMTNTYARGTVTGTSHVGGLIGSLTDNSEVINSFSTGALAGTGNVGGLIGSLTTGATATTSFWDVTTSGQAISAGGTASDTVMMQQLSLFLDAGWSIVEGSDCRSTWGLISTRNDGYPYLQVFHSRACSDTSLVPPSWFKSYLRTSPEVECETGWSPSWEQWPHGGTGGFVCNQEIFWDLSRNGWSTRSLEI